jgi:hypothetical protein
LLTDATTLVVVLTTIDEGGCVANEMEIGCAGPAVIVIEADTDLVVSATEVAMIVTAAGEGTAAGAV